MHGHDEVAVSELEHEVRVRNAREDDMAAVAAIYAEQVLHGIATFELVPPDVAEMQKRREAVLASGLPYLVAECRGAVVGYCYATPYRPRPAYRYCVEDSVYVAEGQQGRGVGRRLLAELIERCEAAGFRQMVAIVGNSANTGSLRLHERLGFRLVGILESVGFKHGLWVDTVLMQRALGDGARMLPGGGA